MSGTQTIFTLPFKISPVLHYTVLKSWSRRFQTLSKHDEAVVEGDKKSFNLKESLVAALNEGLISKEDEPSINHPIEDDLHLEGDGSEIDCDDDEEPTALNEPCW